MTSAQSQIEAVKECTRLAIRMLATGEAVDHPNILDGMDEIAELVGYRRVESWNRVY
jgi:hypothetical protein